MKVSSIFVLSALLCGLYAAGPTWGSVLSESQALADASGLPNLRDTISDAIGNLYDRETEGITSLRELPNLLVSNLTRIVQGLTSWKNSAVLPKEASQAIDQILYTLSQFLRSARYKMGNYTWNWVPAMSNVSIERIRRSIDPQRIISSLSEATSHPIVSMEQAMRAFQNVILNRMMQIATQLLRASWRFLSTRGLPWLHDNLDSMDKTNVLPPYVSTLIENFDFAYGMLKMLGYIQPANASADVVA